LVPYQARSQHQGDQENQHRMVPVKETDMIGTRDKTNTPWGPRPTGDKSGPIRVNGGKSDK
jgi:hypothetical protein